MIDRIRLRRNQMLEAERQLSFSVLVWGPGDPLWMEKRGKLVSVLKDDKFDAQTSEFISKQDPPTKTLPFTPSVEEQWHWPESDLVLLLAFKIGPWTELSQFSLFRDFRKKTVVFYPWEWHSVRNFRQTYWGSVLDQFLKTKPVVSDEISNCSLVDLCFNIARQARRDGLRKRRQLN